MYFFTLFFFSKLNLKFVTHALSPPPPTQIESGFNEKVMQDQFKASYYT